MDKELIDNAIKNGKGEIGYVIPNDLKKYLVEQSFESLNDWESNGWDHDFWGYFKHPDGSKWCFSGSWYYGNYQLNKIDE